MSCLRRLATARRSALRQFYLPGRIRDASPPTSLRAAHVWGTNNNQETQCTFSREALMLARKAARLLGGLMAAGAMLGMAASAQTQDNDKKIKIGVIFDLTGPLAGGGSELQYIGAKIMLDHYAKTGVEGSNIGAVYADAHSTPDVAINEAVR